MTTLDPEIIARAHILAEELRNEGRIDDENVLRSLLSVAEQTVEPERYLTTGQVARRVGVSRQTVVNWINRGVIPGTRLGGRLVVPSAAMKQFVYLENLLNDLDGERAPLSAEEASEIVRTGRENWHWQQTEK